MGYLNEKSPKQLPAKEQIRELRDFFMDEDPETEYLVRYSLEIADEISGELKRRGWTQKILAGKLGKRESEISRWLNGMHNFTLKSLAKLSAVFGRPLIISYSKAHSEFARRTVIEWKRPEPVSFGREIHRLEHETRIIEFNKAG